MNNCLVFGLDEDYIVLFLVSVELLFHQFKFEVLENALEAFIKIHVDDIWIGKDAKEHFLVLFSPFPLKLVQVSWI